MDGGRLADARETEGMLAHARGEADALRSRVAAAEKGATEGAAQVRELSTRTRELEDRCKERVRAVRLGIFID
jgi:hypothetical protein